MRMMPPLRWLACSLVLLSANMVQAAYFDEVMSDSPVAYWRLNEKDLGDPVIDATGNVGPGEFDAIGPGLEPGFPGAVAGADNTAVQFTTVANFSCNGDCGRIALPVGGPLDLGNIDSSQPISLEAWFKVLPNTEETLPGVAYPRIFHYNNFELGQYSFGIVGDDNAGFPATRSVWAARGDGTGSSEVILAGDTDAIESTDEEAWYHFVAHLTGDDVRLFLNGEELLDLTEADPIFWQAEQATIGARLQSDEVSLVQAFPGLIDELAIYSELLPIERIRAHYEAGLGLGKEDDIDALSAAIRNNSTEARFDLNNDGSVNAEDRRVLIEEVKNTYFGDANFDGEFNSSDFVLVFQRGEYEDEVADNSVWMDGDWNGDADFDSSDFVVAFQAGGYEQGPRAAVAAVPEPSGLLLALLGLAGLCLRRRR